MDADSSAVFGCLRQVLEVVRSNYDTLTLKLQDGLDQYERYSEQHKEAAFFKELVSCLDSAGSTILFQSLCLQPSQWHLGYSWAPSLLWAASLHVGAHVGSEQTLHVSTDLKGPWSSLPCNTWLGKNHQTDQASSCQSVSVPSTMGIHCAFVVVNLCGEADCSHLGLSHRVA